MNVSQKDLLAMIGDQAVQIRILEQQVAQLERQIAESKQQDDDEVTMVPDDT